MLGERRKNVDIERRERGHTEDHRKVPAEYASLKQAKADLQIQIEIAAEAKNEAEEKQTKVELWEKLAREKGRGLSMLLKDLADPVAAAG